MNTEHKNQIEEIANEINESQEFLNVVSDVESVVIKLFKEYANPIIGDKDPLKYRQEFALLFNGVIEKLSLPTPDSIKDVETNSRNA